MQKHWLQLNLSGFPLMDVAEAAKALLRLQFGMHWGLLMEHRQIVRASSFGPDAMKMLFTAFDGAWGEIAPRISATPVVVEAARMSLATIVLGLASTELTTPDGLRTMAVAMFCARHRIEVGTDEREVARQRRQRA